MSKKEELQVEDDGRLLLDNQLCFALYVCSKEIIRKYKPFLDPLGLTYTSYITMMALWEQDNVNVKELGSHLYLDSGTLTPILKKLEKQGYIKRQRSKEDERNVVIHLTKEGRELKQKCMEVPVSLVCSMYSQEELEKGKAEGMSSLVPALHELMQQLAGIEEDEE